MYVFSGFQFELWKHNNKVSPRIFIPLKSHYSALIHVMHQTVTESCVFLNFWFQSWKLQSSFKLHWCEWNMWSGRGCGICTSGSGTNHFHKTADLCRCVCWLFNSVWIHTLIEKLEVWSLLFLSLFHTAICGNSDISLQQTELTWKQVSLNPVDFCPALEGTSGVEW